MMDEFADREECKNSNIRSAYFTMLLHDYSKKYWNSYVIAPVGIV